MTKPKDARKVDVIAIYEAKASTESTADLTLNPKP